MIILTHISHPPLAPIDHISTTITDDQSSIPILITPTTNLPPTKQTTSHNPSNFAPIKFSTRPQPTQHKLVLYTSINVCSLGDSFKTDTIMDFITSTDANTVSLSETWLKNDPSYGQQIAEINPPGYQFYHWPCSGRWGGGVGILVRKPLHAKLLPSTSYHRDCSISTSKLHLRFINIYQPPSSAKNKLTAKAFIEGFTTFLESLAVHPGNIIMCGDFNVHMDVQDDPLSCRLGNIIESFGLKHVTGATPKAGHTLDLLISHVESDLVESCVITDPGISDHSAINFTRDHCTSLKP